MRARLTDILVLAVFGIGGCGMGSNDDTGGPALQPLPTTLPGVYNGNLPCSNCAVIAATLWLRDDGRFVLRQLPTDSAGGSAIQETPSYALGRWHWDGLRAEAVLRGAGPERRLTPIDADRLRLHAVSSVEQTLSRDPDGPAFTDRLTLDGQNAVTEHGAVFTECLTKLPLPVATTGAYRELRRQQRLLNPHGKMAVTTVEGHLGVATDGKTEVLVVDRVVTLKPGRSC